MLTFSPLSSRHQQYQSILNDKIFSIKLKRLIILSVATVLLSLSCGKKNDPAPPAVKPSIKIEDASQTRSASSNVMHFRVTLDRTTTVNVSVDYAVKDGTAKAGKDFTAATGTLTFAPNQSNSEITVKIAGDPTDTRENNLEFTVELTNPKNGSIGDGSATGTIITENGSNFVTDNSGYSTPLNYPGYTLVWSDEFTGNTLNTNDWNYEIGNGSAGWGNNELEYYTNNTKNVFVSNGNLIIEARKESISGFNFTSARLTTQNKKQFQYGRIDIRAKLPKGKGVWPALWMLGSNINSVPWPGCGEIDIMELLGHEPNKVYSTMHYGIAAHGSKGNSFSLSSGSFYDQFHVFSMIWEADKIQVFVDDIPELVVNKSEIGSDYPFNAPFFFIMNVAVGGNWPGSPDNTTVFPQRMIVDYVRVFQ